MAKEQTRSVSFEGYEHHHVERGGDWFWILGIVTLAVTIAAIVLGNVLFGILIFIAGLVSALQAARAPRLITFDITLRGLQIAEKTYPYSTLETFFIDEENPNGPQLLVKSKKLFMPLIVIPIPDDYVDEIEDIVASRLPEEHLEEPFAHKIMEFFGF